MHFSRPNLISSIQTSRLPLLWLLLCLLSLSWTTLAQAPSSLDVVVNSDPANDRAQISWYSASPQRAASYEVRLFNAEGMVALLQRVPAGETSFRLEGVKAGAFASLQVAMLDPEETEIEVTPMEELFARGAESPSTITVGPEDGRVRPASAGSALALSLVQADSSQFPFIHVTVRATTNGEPTDILLPGDFRLREGGELQQDYFSVTPPGAGEGRRIADIVFIIDTSSSMGPEIEGVRDNCRAFADALGNSDIDYRLGLVSFGQFDATGAPRMVGSGLTANKQTFKDFVSTLAAETRVGNTEPGFAAIRYAIANFNFRPGAQKVLVLITDEDSDDRDKANTISLIQANHVTVHAAVNCANLNSNTDYCDSTSVRAVSGGLLFGVLSSYEAILSTIASHVGNTYILTYRTSNTNWDGTTRHGIVSALHSSGGASVNFSYRVGGAPAIERTAETIALDGQPLVAGSTPTLSVFVTDSTAPFVQAVTLFVRSLTPDSTFSSLAMSPQGNNRYAAEVPGDLVATPGIGYYFRATDGQVTTSLPEGDPEVNAFHIAALPNVAPEIIHEPHTLWNEGMDLPIQVHVNDSTHSIKRLAVIYRTLGQFMYKVTDRTYEEPLPTSVTETFVIPAHQVNPPTLQYYIKAIDDLGISSIWPAGGADQPQPLPINARPVADVGPALTVSAGANCLAQVELNASASTDPDGEALTYLWKQGETTVAATVTHALQLPVGSHSFTLLVTDPGGLSSQDTIPVTVTDVDGPQLVCPNDLTVECLDASSCPVAFTFDATDPCSGLAEAKCDPPSGSSFSVGQHPVNCMAIDNLGNRTACSFSVTVVGDTTPPVVTVSSPLEGTTVYLPLARITGTASDNSGIVGVSWANAANDQSGSCTGTTSWHCDVPLQSGPNPIAITARDAADNRGPRQITVNYMPITTLSLTKNVDWIYANGFSVAKIEAALLTQAGEPPAAPARVTFSVRGDHDWLLFPEFVEQAGGLSRNRATGVPAASVTTDAQGKAFVFLRGPLPNELPDDQPPSSLPPAAWITATLAVNDVPIISDEVAVTLRNETMQFLSPLTFTQSGVEVSVTVPQNDFVLREFTQRWMTQVLSAFADAGIELTHPLSVKVDIGPDDLPEFRGGVLHVDVSKHNMAHESTHWLQKVQYGLPVPNTSDGSAAWFTEGMAHWVERTLTAPPLDRATLDFLPASQWWWAVFWHDQAKAGRLMTSAADFLAFAASDETLRGVARHLGTARQVSGLVDTPAYLYAEACLWVADESGRGFFQTYQDLRKAWTNEFGYARTWATPLADVRYARQFVLACPAELALVDSEGRRLDKTHSEIPGAIYEQQEVAPGDFRTSIALDQAAEGTYELTVLSTARSGEAAPFSLYLSSYDWEKPLALDQPLPVGTSTTLVFHLTLAGTNVFYDAIQFHPPFDRVADKTVECGTVWSFDQPSATSLCSGSNIVITVLDTLTNTPPGAILSMTRWWEAADACGNKTNCSQTVTLVDTTPPVLVCPPSLSVEFADETGAAVIFAPTASDCCSSVSILSTPPSGSVFPIGLRPVLVVATDASGNTDHCSFNVHVLGARGVKERVLAELSALPSDLFDREGAKKLAEAIRHLTESLAPELWEDQTHLTRKHGDRVFHEEKETVQNLRELIRSKESPVDAETLHGLIDRIVRADRLLAMTSIQEAARAGVNPKKIAEDLEQLEKGDRENTEGKPDHAIEHYRHAWKHAVHLKVKGVRYLANGVLRMNFLGLEGQTYVIQASTNLANWMTLCTCQADAEGNIEFIDPDANRHVRRFYRVVEP